VFQRSETLAFPGTPLIRRLRRHLLPHGEKGELALPNAIPLLFLLLK
jgi:hypothetical protein